MTPSNSRAAADKGNMVSAGIGSADRVAVGGEHAAFERRAILARSPHQPYAAKMDRERELKIIRRAYAKQVTAAAGVGDPQVEAAFAAVAREDFLGPGPWHIVRWGGGYRATPDADPITRTDPLPSGPDLQSLSPLLKNPRF